jgi:hypothetical protein
VGGPGCKGGGCLCILVAFRNSPGLKLTSVDPTEYVRFKTVDGSPMTASSGGTVLADDAVTAAAKTERARARRIVAAK